MKVLPYILYRTTNKNFDELLNLNLNEFFSLLKEYEKDCGLLQSEIDRSTESLFQLIKECQDDEERKILINIKRDIHNCRNLKANELSKIHAEKSNHLNQLLQAYSSRKSASDGVLSKINDSYSNEIKELRRKLIELSSEELFKKGIVLSSKAIFQSLDNYINDNHKLNGKKKNQIENGLIKYISRVYAKTSPFSTFTSIGLLKRKPGENNFSRLGNSEGNIKSFVSVNNNIFLLFKSYLVEHETLKFKIPLKVNPTLTTEHDKYAFLTNNYFNVESIQRLKLNPFINAIVSNLNETKGTDTEALVQRLLEVDEFDNTAREIKDYIWHLVHSGFFELDLKTSGLDPNWVNAFRLFLINYLPLENKSVLELINLIDLLLEGSKKISGANAGERAIITDKIYNTLSATFKLAKKETNKAEVQVMADGKHQNIPEKEKEEHTYELKYNLPIDISPESIFFEDTLTNKGYSLSGNFVQDTCAKLKDLFEHLWIFEPNNEEKQLTKDFFTKTYGEESIVPALKFYEDFYAFYLGDKTPPEQKSETSGSYWSELSRKWTQTFYDYVNADRLLDKDNVFFNLSDLIAVNQNAGIEISKNYRTSIGALLQMFVNEDGGENCVINSLFCGFGKLFSRFLYLLDTDLMASIKEHINTTLDEEVLTCETADTSIMNANMHPPIMEYEIAMPFANSVLPEEKRIPINQVLIKLDKSTNELRLMDSVTKKVIYVYYLGFQSFDYRSKLFQMLTPFSNFKQPLLYTFTEMINTKFNKVNNITEETAIQIKPRITYENTIVIQRKSVMVNPSKLPVSNPNMTEAEYFISIQKWKEEIGLPDMVFIRIILPKDDSQHLFGVHDRKPQFIDFRNPFLVQRLQKICSKAKSGVEFTEMLPTHEQLITDHGEKFVTEYLVEYYS